MFMCTNKTCFAGVGTWPKPIFRIRDFCMVTLVSLAPSHLSYGGSSLTSSLLKSLWVIYDVFSTLDGSSAPVTCSCVCTNKTCFAGVGTWPKAIFWIGMISFVSCPCESKKNQNFLSTDQTSIPGVNQVFPVLEWNLIFVLLSKILDRLKRLIKPGITLDIQLLQRLHQTRSGKNPTSSRQLWTPRTSTLHLPNRLD